MNNFLITLLFLHLVLVSMVWQDAKQKDLDFPTLQKLSVEELRLKTEAHVGIWGLDKIKRWDLDQGEGDIVFTLKDQMKAVAPAQIIGTYNTEDHTWLWAWANSSVNEKLQVDALKLRKYGEEHHIEKLTTAKWVGTEDEAWAMTALAVKLCDKQGAYLGPAGPTHVFIAFGKVALSNERAVGAALRGRPWFNTGFKERWSRIRRTSNDPRAATEGRPYSTFRVDQRVSSSGRRSSCEL
jgi:hypothetical protein